MKALKQLLALAVLPLALVGCRIQHPVAQEGGKEDIAYVLVVSPTSSLSGAEVEVSLDGGAPFRARVTPQKRAHRSGTRYSVKPGARSVRVTRGGQTLYDKKIFLSTQEVKQIVLP